MKIVKRRIAAAITLIAVSASLFIGLVPVNSKYYEDTMEEKLKTDFINHLKGIDDNNSYTEEKSINEQDENETVTIMVMLKDKSAIEETNDKKLALTKEEEVKSSQESIINETEKITGSKVLQSFGYLVNGFSIEGKVKDIDEIKKISGVEDAYASQKYETSMYGAQKITEAASTWKDYGYKGEGMVISVIDTEFDVNHKDFVITDSSKAKLSEEKVDNIINNELEGRGKYFNEKVPYGYNYVNYNTNLKSDKMHGMHVAGIIAANGSNDECNSYKAIKGVAPEAQILAMRVGDDNGAIIGNIILAIEDSVKLDADVINMSFGNDGYVTRQEELLRIALNKANALGTVCVQSAGNSQIAGAKSVDDRPNNSYNLKDTSIVDTVADNVILAASLENNFGYCNSEFNFTDKKNKSHKFTGNLLNSDDDKITNSYTEIVNCYGSEDDLYNIDLDGKIALVHWTYNSINQIKYAIDNSNALGLIFESDYDTVANDVDQYITSKDMTIICINKKDGENLRCLLGEGNDKYKIERTKVNKTINNESERINNFSSWGTSPDLELKPDITAPGGNISSTVNDDSYAYMSGTSMASPHIAGGQAIILQALKEKLPNMSKEELTVIAKNSMMNTAKILHEESNMDLPYSPRRQGAGLLQIEKAIKNDVIAVNAEDTSKATLALKNISNEKEFTIKLVNYGKENRSYSLNNEKLYSEITDEDGYIQEVEINGALAEVYTNNVTVKPGEEVLISGKVKINDGAIEKQNFVEGFITLESLDGEPSLSIPLIAFYGDYSKETILDPPLYSSESRTLQTRLTSDYNTITLGRYFNNAGYIKYVDDFIAISPNDDNIQDKAKLNMFFLRNSKQTTISILDDEKNVLSTPRVYKDGYKLTASLNNYSDYEFNGKMYDIASGNDGYLVDGQYYIRVKTMGYTENAKEQTTDIPIKIDTKAPELDIKSLSSYDKDGKTIYVLRFDAQDDFSDIYKSVAISTDNNSEGTQYFDAVKKKNGLYEVEFTLGGSNRVNNVRLAMSDNAGNVGYASKELFIEPENVINLYNLHDGMVFNKSKYSTVGYFLRGDVRSDVDKLYINDEPVYMNNGIINGLINFEDGNNELNIVAKDINGKILYEVTYNVYLDMEPPSIKNVSPFNEFRNYIPKEDEKTVKAEFEFSEELKSASFSIDGKELDAKYIDGKYVMDIDVSGLEQIIDIIYMDKGENEKEELYFINKNKDPYVPKEVVFQTSLGNKYTYLPKYSDDEFMIKGNFIDSAYYDRDDITITINGDKADLTDNNGMYYYYKLTEGKNIVNIKVIDSEKVLYENQYILIYDKSAPVIEFDKEISDMLSDVKPNGRIYLSNNKEPLSNIKLSGTISENLSSYSLFINGDYVLDVNTGDSYEGQYGDIFTRKFEKNIELYSGMNFITYYAYDKINNWPGNTDSKVYSIYNGSIVPNTPTITNSSEGDNEKEFTLSSSDYDLDKIEWSLDGKNYIEYKEPIKLTEDSTIYARALSYTGDYSEVVTQKVVFDKKKEVIPPEINVQKTEDETKATISITSPEEDIDRIEYSFDDENYIIYENPIEINKTSTIYAKAYNKDGDCSTTISKEIELKIKEEEEPKKEDPKEEPKDNPKEEPKQEMQEENNDEGNMTNTSDNNVKQILSLLVLLECSLLVMLKIRKKIK